MIDPSKLPGAKVFTWNREYLFKVLTEGKNAVLHDPNVINAFRMVDRKDFIKNELKHRAYEDIDLELGFEEKFTRPTVLAQMVQLLKPKVGGKYLDLGSGTGYIAMILGFIAGQTGYVYSVERIQWLWEMSRQNAIKYKNIKNVKFLYKDGSNGLPDQAPFDGIHVSFALESIPESWKQQLSQDGGILVAPLTNYNIRVIERHGVDEFIEEIVPGFVFQSGKVGLG